jgi:hypothetical protein
MIPANDRAQAPRAGAILSAEARCLRRLARSRVAALVRPSAYCLGAVVRRFER